MAPRRRRNGRRRRGGNFGSTIPWNFSSTFAGASKNITLTDLGIDSSRAIRVVSVRCTVAIVGHTQCPTLYLTLPASTGSDTVGAISRPVTIGVSPVRLSVRNFSGTDFRTHGTGETLCVLLLKNYYNGQVTVSGTVTIGFMRNDAPGVVKAVEEVMMMGSQ